MLGNGAWYDTDAGYRCWVQYYQYVSSALDFVDTLLSKCSGNRFLLRDWFCFGCALSLESCLRDAGYYLL